MVDSSVSVTVLLLRDNIVFFYKASDMFQHNMLQHVEVREMGRQLLGSPFSVTVHHLGILRILEPST